MKKKSILPLVTVTMLATALLGGCVNKTESTTTSEATPTEAVKEGNSYAGQTTITNSTITTDADGAAGAFAYGDGTVYISDSTIKTTGNTAGGIHAAGGGTLYAWDLDVETDGNFSAAIRSDRGGGTMVVDGGTYTSNGTGSPAVYSTADIAVSGATLTANGSEAVCIEGLNSLPSIRTWRAM